MKNLRLSDSGPARGLARFRSTSGPGAEALEPRRLLSAYTPNTLAPTPGPLAVLRAPSATAVAASSRRDVDTVALSASALSASNVVSATAMTASNITLGGTLGKAQSVASTNHTFAITPSYGDQIGGNLFYSFQIFKLGAGDTASFAGPATVKNVFVRVTGKTPSTIDGTIASAIPNANVFFMNPNGVIFQSDASLNTLGGFNLTTANYIRFTDNTKFAASNPSNAASLSAAAPAAFGFTSRATAGISVNGLASSTASNTNPIYQPTLNPASGKSLIVVGGDITITSGELASNGAGPAGIASVGSAGEALLAQVNGANVLNVSSFSRLGAIRVTDGGFLGSDAYNGVNSGPVTINAAGGAVRRRLSA